MNINNFTLISFSNLDSKILQRHFKALVNEVKTEI